MFVLEDTYISQTLSTVMFLIQYKCTIQSYDLCISKAGPISGASVKGPQTQPVTLIEQSS